MGIVASSLPETQDHSKNTSNSNNLRLVVNGNAYKVSSKDLQDYVVLSNSPQVVSLLQAVRVTKDIDSLQLSLPQQQLDEFLKSPSGSVFTLDQSQQNLKTSSKQEQTYQILGQLSPTAIQQRGRALPIRSAYVHAEGKENDQTNQNLRNLNENAINKINLKKVTGGTNTNVLSQASSNTLLPVVRPFQYAYASSSCTQQESTTQIVANPPLSVSESTKSISVPLDPYILPSTAFLASLNSQKTESNINTTMITSPFVATTLNSLTRTRTTPSNLPNISSVFPNTKPLVSPGVTQPALSSVVPPSLSSSLALKNTIVSSLNTTDSKLIPTKPFSSSTTAYILNTPTKTPVSSTTNIINPTAYLTDITLPPKAQCFIPTGTVPFSARSNANEENISSQLKTESSQYHPQQERTYLNPRSSSSCNYRSSITLNKPQDTINISYYLSQCKQNKTNGEFINNQSPVPNSLRTSQSLNKRLTDGQTSNYYAASREEQAECNFQAAQQLIESANQNIAQATRISMPNLPKIAVTSSTSKPSITNSSSQQTSHSYATPVSQNKSNQDNFVESVLSNPLPKTRSFNQLPPSVPYYFGRQQQSHQQQQSQRGHQQTLFESDHYLRTSSSSISQMDQDGMNCFQQSNTSNNPRWCQLQSSLSPIPKITNGNLATDNSRSMMSESNQHNTTAAPIILSSRKSTEACERSMRQSSSSARDAISKIIHETVQREVDNLKKINESSLQKHLRENQHKMNVFLDKEDSRQRLQSLHNSRELNKSFSDISTQMKNGNVLSRQQSINNNDIINNNNQDGYLHTSGEQIINYKNDPFNATWRQNNHNNNNSKQIASSQQSSLSVMPQNQSFYRTAAFNNNNNNSNNILAVGGNEKQGEFSRRQSSCCGYEGELFQGDIHDMHSQQQQFVVERQRHVSIMSDLDIQPAEQNQQKESQQRQSQYDRQDEQEYRQQQFATSYGHTYNNNNYNNNNNQSQQYSPIEQNQFQNQPSATTGLFFQSSVGKECSGWLEKQPIVDMSPYQQRSAGGGNGMYDEPLAARDLTGENEEQQDDLLVEEGYYDDLESQADNNCNDISNNNDIDDDVSENNQQEEEEIEGEGQDQGIQGYQEQQDQENNDELYEDYQHGGYEQQQQQLTIQMRDNYNDQGVRNNNNNYNDCGGDLMQTLSSGCTFQPTSFGYTTSTVKQSQKLLSFSPLPQNQLQMQVGLQSQHMNDQNDYDNQQVEQEQYDNGDDEGQTSLSQISLSPLRPSSNRIDGEEDEDDIDNDGDQQMMYYCSEDQEQQNQDNQEYQDYNHNINSRNNFNQFRDQQLQCQNQFNEYQQQQQLGQFDQQQQDQQEYYEQNGNGSDFEDQYDDNDGYDCQEELNEYQQQQQQEQEQEEEDQDVWKHQQSVYQPQQQFMHQEGELYEDQSDVQDDESNQQVSNKVVPLYEDTNDMRWDSELQEVEQRFIASRQQQRDLSAQYNEYLAQMQSQVTSSSKKNKSQKDSYGMRNSQEDGDINQIQRMKVTATGIRDSMNRVKSINEQNQVSNNNNNNVGMRQSGRMSKETKNTVDNNNNDDFIAELESISLRSARGLMNLSQRIQHSNSSLVLDKSNIHDDTAIAPTNDLQRLSEYVISSGNHNKDNTHGISPVRNRCVSLDGQNAKHKRNTGRFGQHRSRDLALSFDPLNCTAHEIMSYMHATNVQIQQKKEEMVKEGETDLYNEGEQQEMKMNQDMNVRMEQNKEFKSEQEQKIFTDSMRKHKVTNGDSQKNMNGNNRMNVLIDSDAGQEMIENNQEGKVVEQQLQETFKGFENLYTTEEIGENQKQEIGVFGQKRQVKSKDKRMSFVEYQLLELQGNKNQDKEKEDK